MNDIERTVVSTIICDILESLPDSILKFYRDVPGRNPGQHSKEIEKIVSSISDDDIIKLIRDIVDSALFSTLHLFDLKFKDKKIEVSFTPSKNTGTSTSKSLLELYRQRVDPGGIIVAVD